MSGITRKLYDVLLRANAPMTHAELAVHFVGFPPSALGATLSNQHRMGRIVRKPAGSRYAYALSDWMLAQLQAEGVDGAVRENASGHRRTVRDVAADRAQEAALSASQDAALRMDALPTATVECAALDPLELRRLQALPPSVGTVLPWLDEEEAPPVIGERWRDALRPRPLDD